MLYKGDYTKNISFPLGGIGTGCIGLGGNGELKDWEIFNRPNKCTRNGYSHFAIKATHKGSCVAKVLHGDTAESLIGTSCSSTGHYGYGYGPRANSLAGFEHFTNVEFDGTFPIARLTFSDEGFPATVRLCAFNPFIPHDEYNSSLPVAFFEWEIENTADEAVRFALACTVYNSANGSLHNRVSDGSHNGVFMKNSAVGEDETDYFDMCILTDSEDVDVQEYWYRGPWMDSPTTYWKNFKTLERMPERSYAESGKGDHGTVVSHIDIDAGQKAKIRYVIAWNVPNCVNYWRPRYDGSSNSWRNYYATQFKSSFESAKYALDGFGMLYEKTALFSDTVQESTVPEFVKDAISANLSVIKTPTALRLEGGEFWGWEGCAETVGSCFGSCQHVWNYAYALPYLFPKLERSMREVTFKYGLMENGATSFRINLPPRREMAMSRACVDGQMGEVIKCYREWKFSGDDAWLREHSEEIFKMLEYAWSKDNPDKWDADMDGVLEGRQHHTLDMELFGPSSWLEGFYLLALDCASEMAEYLGEENRASLYRRLYESGKKWTNDNLFNGRYFYQRTELSNKALTEAFDAVDYWNDEAREIKYQIGEGSIIDQMLADWHSALIGRGGVFDSDKKKTALKSLYKYNYVPSMRTIANMWRNFSLDDEAGTVICSYPEGAYIPAIPIPYCEETMTGFEYALAGLMLSEGYVMEGESMIKAVRDRYDGARRNPYNEIECGSNYARSMASYAFMPIYSGFGYDMTKKSISFSPISGEGRYLFSVCESWGSVDISNDASKLTVFGKPLELKEISVPNCEGAKLVTVDGKSIAFEKRNGYLVFDAVITKELLIK